MSCHQAVRRISECFIKPLHGDGALSLKPIHFTPFELPLLNANYSQKGLLFAKPPAPENQDFDVAPFLDDLRHSLSVTLTCFHPLAARLATRKQENPPSYVIYLDPRNSPGVKFIYAKVDAAVSDVLTPIHVPPVVHSFFDLSKAINHDGHTLPLLSIQVTELVDGIFIGGSVNHLVADGTSFWHFMAAWSEVFQSKGRHTNTISRSYKRCPLEGFNFDTISLPYTHHNEFVERLEPDPAFKERFFHFSLASVSKLKAKANEESKTHNISSLQAVSALLWRCITRARRLPHDSETSCRLVVSVRPRLNPPLSDHYFGNPIQTVRGIASVGDLLGHGLGWAGLRLQVAVRNHDDAAVRKGVESWVRRPVIHKLSQFFDSSTIHIGSSPRFDMYGCEFGLGKAVAARSGCVNKADGKITMFPGVEGGGSMDVEVCLLPKTMVALDNDQEFMSALRIH